MTDSIKLNNVKKEHDELCIIMNKHEIGEEHELFQELYTLNLQFWEYHDWQREQWKRSDDNYINLELYKKNKEEHILNDKRAEIKKKINLIFKSEIVEEKQFLSYNI